MRLITVLICLLVYNCVAQDLEWAKSYIPVSDTKAPVIINISPSKRIGLTGGLTNNNFPMNYKNGIFLNCMDSLGTVLWGDTILTRVNRRVTGLAFSSGDEIFLSGNFYDTLRVNGVTYLGKNFIAKYNSAGIIQWVKTSSKGSIENIFVDKNQNLYVLMTVTDTLSFYNQTIIPQGASDIVIAKINSNNSLTFLKQCKTNGTGMKISVAEAGNIFVFGKHQDTLHVGSWWSDWTHKGTADEFVLKLDSLGSVLSFSYSCNDFFGGANDFAVAPDEKFLVTGSWSHHGAVSTLQTFNQSGKIIASSGFGYCQGDANVSTNDTSGFWAFYQETHYLGPAALPDSTWFNQALVRMNFSHKLFHRNVIAIEGGSRAIATDKSGAVYIASAFAPAQTFSINGVTLSNTNASFNAMYVAKFRSNGNYVGMKENLNLSPSIVLFPNPCSETATLRLNDSPNQALTVNVFNALGNLLFTNRLLFDRSEIELPIKNLVPGVYFIKIDEINKCLKLVKQ